MTERWKIQLGQGINIAFIYIFIQIFSVFFIDSKSQTVSDLLTEPLFYLHSLVCFLFGLIVVGYVAWKFPKKKPVITHNTNPVATGRHLSLSAELKNYILNNAAFALAIFTVIELGKFPTDLTIKRTLFLLPFALIGGSAFGYFEWRRNRIEKQ